MSRRTKSTKLGITILLLATMYPLSAWGQGQFQRNDHLYDDHTIQFNNLGTTLGSLQVALNHPGGSPSFTITIPPQPGYTDGYPLELDLDLNGDGYNDITQPLADHAISGTWTYPTPTHWVDKYNVSIHCVERTYAPSTQIQSTTFPVYVAQPTRIYADAASNALVQMRDEDCTSKVPVLLVEGWDPLNTSFPWEYEYAFASTLDSIYNNNGEVFVLNFADAGRSMLLNADVVIAAVAHLHTLCPSHQTAVIGFSMGGVVAQYALAKAERQGVQHNVSLFVSYDSPHKGANANGSLQAQLEGTNIPTNLELAALKTEMQSVAAKQLLIYDSYDVSRSEYDWFHAVADTANLNGMPHLSYNVAISNGGYVSPWEEGTLLDGQLWLADALVYFDNGTYRTPIIHIDNTALDVSPGSLRHMTTSLSYHRQIGFLWFNYDVGVTLQTNFDPMFVPTWSALGVDIDQVNRDARGNITGFRVPIPYDDTLTQATTLYHQDVSAATQRKVMGWFRRTSSLTVQYQLDAGGSVPSDVYQVPLFSSIAIAVGPKVVTVNGHSVTYVFDHWDDGSTANPRSFTQPRDATHSAVLRAQAGVAWERFRFGSSTGNGAAIGVESDGSHNLLYVDRGSNAKRIVYVQQVATCSWERITVDSTVNYGFLDGVSMAVGPNSSVACAYVRQDGGASYKLRVIRGTTYLQGTLPVFGAPVDVGSATAAVATAIKIDAAGVAHIAYVGTGSGGGGVYYARVSAAGALMGAPELVSSLSFAGSSGLSLALDSQGSAVVAFATSTGTAWETGSGGLGFARRSNGVWTAQYQQLVEQSGGWGCSLALDASDEARISHFALPAGGSPTMHLTKWSNQSSVWADTTFSVPVGWSTSALSLTGAKGYPCIATWGAGYASALVWQSDAGWSVTSMDVAGGQVSNVQMFIDVDGSPVVSYSASSSVSLIKAHLNTWPDVTAPAAVTNLTLGVGKRSAALSWSAPGNDGNVGQAQYYDLRYAANAITSDVTFTTATPIISGVSCPSPAGAGECATVNGLSPCSPVYFALKTGDAAGNWSPLSNVVHSTMHCTGGEILCDGGGGYAARHVIGDEDARGSAVLSLHVASSNPVHTRAELALNIPAALASQRVELRVFDALGRHMRTLVSGALGAGMHPLNWDLSTDGGERARGGVYFVQLRVGGQRVSRSLIIVE